MYNSGERYDIMYEYYDDYEETDLSKKNNYTKYIKYVVLIIIFLVISVFLYQLFNNNKSLTYSDYESKLIKNAQNYVQKNNIITTKEVYLDVLKLNVSIPSNCAKISGVIYDGNNYYANLVCDDYESEIIKNNTKNVSLIGNSIYVLLKGMKYNELGYQSMNKVTINGEVQDEEGIYNLYYITDNGEVATRKVIVIDNISLKEDFPTILLNGDETVYLNKNELYEEQGYIAYDKEESLEKKVVKLNNVDNTTVGEYKIIYYVRNKLGYVSSVVRKIIIKDEVDINIISELSTNNMTNHNVKIIINVLSDEYSYTILPNNEETTRKNYEYEVSENGVYKFVIVDKNGKMINHEVLVNNIDKELPKASCVAKVYSQNIKIETTNQGSKPIVGYNYIINGNEHGFVTDNTYTISKINLASVEVEITDILSNTNIVTCQVENQDPSIGNNNVKYYTYNNTEYVIANTPNDLTNFEKRTCRNIAQVVDKENCGEACLSFALYYAAYIQKGDVSKMNQYNACNYNYGSVASFDITTNLTKQDALKRVYDEILNGRVSVLQVTGTLERVSRHFYLIVGYKRDKMFANDLTEEDLLGIDSWNGCFSTLSYYDKTKRTMFDNKDGFGYRVDVFKEN